MKKFYFVGGPKSGKAGEFFRRLDEVGGPPSGWHIYPHSGKDGMALHFVDVESQEDIIRHLQQFEGLYQFGEIIEIVEK